ncbi:hypothetical protein [Streptomyces sp. NRRL B-24085]|uniref:hypothetical protein n=1 Tax=Streptomyces sp. NRRL B-24085 TaxID=1709476 RepID=UPI00131B77C7|nr:hypothetical protein [Streptomyces sp. NRRL B-24085]
MSGRGSRYVLKHAPPHQIVAAVRNVTTAERVLSSTAVKQLTDGVTAQMSAFPAQ